MRYFPKKGCLLFTAFHEYQKKISNAHYIYIGPVFQYTLDLQNVMGFKSSLAHNMSIGRKHRDNRYYMFCLLF